MEGIYHGENKTYLTSDTRKHIAAKTGLSETQVRILLFSTLYCTGCSKMEFRSSYLEMWSDHVMFSFSSHPINTWFHIVSCSHTNRLLNSPIIVPFINFGRYSNKIGLSGEALVAEQEAERQEQVEG